MRCNALPKEFRLNDQQVRSTFNNVGHRFFTEHFAVLVSPPVEDFGIGIIISKKKVKLACKRNLYKRVIREYYRTIKNEKIFKGRYIIVIASHKLNQATKDQLWCSLNAFFYTFKKV